MSYTFLSKKNNAKSTLSAAIIAASTTLNVVSAAPFPSAPFLLTIWNKDLYPDPGEDPAMEIVKCTAKAGSVLTITRAQESTVAASHASGSAVENLFTAGSIVELETQINLNNAASASVLYLGDANTEGSWKLIVVGSTLSVQRLESGVWNEKSAFTS